MHADEHGTLPSLWNSIIGSIDYPPCHRVAKLDELMEEPVEEGALPLFPVQGRST
jgi:hypothetical protein